MEIISERLLRLVHGRWGVVFLDLNNTLLVMDQKLNQCNVPSVCEETGCECMKCREGGWGWFKVRTRYTRQDSLISHPLLYIITFMIHFVMQITSNGFINNCHYWLWICRVIQSVPNPYSIAALVLATFTWQFLTLWMPLGDRDCSTCYSSTCGSIPVGFIFIVMQLIATMFQWIRSRWIYRVPESCTWPSNTTPTSATMQETE